MALLFTLKLRVKILLIHPEAETRAVELFAKFVFPRRSSDGNQASVGLIDSSF